MINPHESQPEALRKLTHVYATQEVNCVSRLLFDDYNLGVRTVGEIDDDIGPTTYVHA